MALSPYKRCGFDRRCPGDRRQALDLDWLDHNPERRSGQERRQRREKRQDWLRYTHWSSVYIGD